MSRKEKSRIDTTGGNGLAADPFAELGALALPPQAEKVDAASSAAGRSNMGNTSHSGAGAASRSGAGSAGRSRGRLDVRWEKSGRGGKSVTVIGGEGFTSCAEAELDALLRQLKNRFGCGGTRGGRTLELQGRRVEEAMDALTQLGYRAVRSGG